MMFWLIACGGPGPVAERPAPEPISQAADPAENSAPVGVRTVDAGGQTAEVWYPAPEASRSDATELANYQQFLPTAVTDLVGEIVFPDVEEGAIRDAPVRVPDGEWPTVIFSHGFGGMRLQSLDYAVHLASRGYVVFAVDHVGRRFEDLLPCIFKPPLEGCDLSGMSGQDGAVEDITALIDWIEGGGGEFYNSPTVIGMSGHSAGGGSTVTLTDLDDRVDAALIMAAPGVPSRDVPTLLLGGTCDSFANASEMADVAPVGGLVEIAAAGHLAFSDLCELHLLELSNATLVDRDDVNSAYLTGLVSLASDGCAEAVPDVETCADASYLPIATSDPIVRHYSTVFFDDALLGEGAGVTDAVYPDATLR